MVGGALRLGRAANDYNMLRYSDVHRTKNKESLDSRDEYLKYFGLILWLPPNIDKFPTYELVSTYNFIATYAVSCCCCKAAHAVFLYSCTIFQRTSRY